MKKWCWSLVIVVSAIWLWSAPMALAQESEEAAPPAMSAEAQAQMQAWMEAAHPGEHHDHLKPYVGKWHGQIKMWMAPGSEPMLNEHSAEADWMMGGRYIQWRHAGSFSGMDFEGFGIDGYNNTAERYESMWIDNMGTLVLLYTGHCEDDGKTRTVSTSFTDPMSGGEVHNRMVFAWIDDEHFKMDSYMKNDTGEFKNMEIVYSRVH